AGRLPVAMYRELPAPCRPRLLLSRSQQGAGSSLYIHLRTAVRKTIRQGTSKGIFLPFATVRLSSCNFVDESSADGHTEPDCRALALPRDNLKFAAKAFRALPHAGQALPIACFRRVKPLAVVAHAE